MFALEGLVIECVIKAPGTLQESSIAGWRKLYQNLEAGFDKTGGQIVVDSTLS